jgi:hypothetical protein
MYSTQKFIKSKYRSVLTDEHLTELVRTAVTTYQPTFKRVTAYPEFWTLILYLYNTLFNPLKSKPVYIVLKDSVRTSKRTPHLTITEVNWLTMFKEVIPVYAENRTKPWNTNWSVTDWYSRWYIYLPLGFKWLIQSLYQSNTFTNFVAPEHEST